MSNNIVSDICHVLHGLDGLEFLLRVGLERGSNEGKIDLLVGCNEGSIETYASHIEFLLRGRWPTAELFVSDDSVRFDLLASGGGIAVCNSTTLIKQINEWTEGKHLGGQYRPWAIGYWLPEALCGDLATAESLYDAKGIYAEIRKLVVPYPSTLSRSIVGLCADETRQKLVMLEKLLEDEKLIELTLCLSDISAAMVRIAFARSHRYLRGFRSLAEQSSLLHPSDLPMYELALDLSKRKRARNLVGKIRRLL